MLLGPLTDALELVCDRIKNFEREFTNNETQTRLSLVDPVLKALDWDPQDPTGVTVEYQVRQRNRNNTRVDYALLDLQRRPVAFVEAKKLGTDLGPAHHQLFEYAVGKTVPYAIATNGADWAIYKQEQTGTEFSSKQLLAVSIVNQTPNLAAIKLLSLWKGLLTSQSSIDQIAPALDALEAEPARQAFQVVPPPVPVSPGEEAGASSPGVKLHHPLPPDNRFTSGKVESFKLDNPPNVSHSKPIDLLFPDGIKMQIYKWSSLLIETVKWLRVNNILSVSIPWKANPSSSRNILQQSEIHNRNGVPIKQQIPIDNNLYLLTNYDAQSICTITDKLLSDCGIRSSEVTVTLTRHGG